jgi:hypothetical protein
VFVADDPAFVPDEYGEAAVLDDCPIPEMVNVKTEAVGAREPVPVTELPAADVAEPESGDIGIVSTVGEPGENVTVMTVAALEVPPVVCVLDAVLPRFDEVPPYVPGAVDVPDGVDALDTPVAVPDGDNPAVPDEAPSMVSEPPEV